jgi:hypothetical protein
MRKLLRDNASALLLGGFPISVIDKDVLPAVTPVHDVVDGARRIYGLTPFRFFDNLEMMCKVRFDMTALAVVGVTVAIAQLVLQLISLLKKK